MLNEVLRIARGRILKSRTPIKLHKLCMSIFARIFKLMTLTTKLDEDLLLDLEDGFIELGNLISDNKSLLKSDKENKFDVNWLLDADIPSNIYDIHKRIKAEGLLR
ncbi:MAG: hypothetical protein HRT66_05740 [Flavobacteriaceae bacterium]|nr:hypothetical protein [Flavobacteriaceae bacterium]